MLPEEDGVTRQVAQPNAKGIHDNPVSSSHHSKSEETENGYHILMENHNPVKSKNFLVKGIHLFSFMCTTKVPEALRK